MSNSIKTVALDIGGIIAEVDYNLLTKEEQAIINIYNLKSSLEKLNFLMELNDQKDIHNTLIFIEEYTYNLFLKIFKDYPYIFPKNIISFMRNEFANYISSSKKLPYFIFEAFYNFIITADESSKRVDFNKLILDLYNNINNIKLILMIFKTKNLTDLIEVGTYNYQINKDNFYFKALKIFDDSFQTLKLIKDMGLNVSIWTNGRANLNNWLEINGFFKYVEPKYVCNSYYLSADKPYITFYNEALIKIDKPAEEVLFIDDTNENIKNALVLGINAFQFCRNKEQCSLDTFIKTKIERR